MHVTRGDGLALGEWLDEYDRPLRWACADLWDKARVDDALRPSLLSVLPARNARWAGMADDQTIWLTSAVARGLAFPQTDPLPRAPAILLHEVGHTAMFKLSPPVLSERFLRAAPTIAHGGHDPIFAGLVGVFYLRAGLSDVVDSYDCGWRSEGANDWPGPDWSLDWSHDFAVRYATTRGDVAALVRAALNEFESAFFARESRRRWRPWRKSENAFTIAAIWRRHR